ncbi:MAG: tetratricopeptide repeat protein, partial [Planctomycetes bacterium]|nr:tetratricopeptide repeat protein [Planctomycetota bacterium]
MSIYRSGDSSAKSLSAFRKITSEDGVHKHDALYMAALVLAEQGDEAGSVELFEQLVSSGSPTYAELARLGLGSAYFKTKNYAASEKLLDQFVRDFPRSTRRDEASYLLSQVRLQSGKKDEATAILRQLVDSPTVGDQASLSLARTLSESGRADEAAETVQAALKLFPHSSLRADLQLELGLTELNANRYDRAAANFSEFLASQRRDAPGVDRATYLLAYTSHRHGRHDESLEQCREFRAHHANSRFLSDVIRLEAENHFATANYPAAVEAYKSWLIQVGTDESQHEAVARAHMRIAQAMYLSERYTEASEHLESNAPPRATTDLLLLSYDYYRGDCNYQLQRYLPAARRFKSYIKRVRAKRNQLDLQPDEREVLQSRMRDARFKLGHSLQLAGKNAAARTAYAHALKADPKTPYRDQLYFELGQVAYKERKLTIAGKSFRRLLKNHPRSEFAPQARFYLGVVESESGDFNRAADHFSALVRRHPDHRLASEGEYRLAIALKSAGKLEEASEVLRQFRTRYPDDERLGIVRLEEAVAISKAGDPEKALHLLSELKESPSAADYMTRILYETAWCYRALGRPEKAVESYTRILDTPEIVATSSSPTETAESSTAVTPGFPSGTNVNQTVRIELAELEFEQKNYKTAKRLLAKLAAEPKVKDAGATDSPKSRHTQGQQNQTVLYRLTWCHHMLEDSDLVQTTFARFEDQFPESELYPELAYLAAKSYLRQDRITEAGKLFKRVARDYPESREAALSLVSYAECQLEDKRFDEAKKVFAGFLKRFPESDVRYRAHFGMGWSDENLGSLKQAIASYRTVTYSTPSPPAARAQFQIGQCFVAS